MKSDTEMTVKKCQHVLAAHIEVAHRAMHRRITSRQNFADESEMLGIKVHAYRRPGPFLASPYQKHFHAAERDRPVKPKKKVHN